MKNKKPLFLSILLVFVFFGETAAQEIDLPERYKKWLEEEVVYIIAPLEKEVFLKLKTDRERDLFIEAFWKHRDPSPGSPDNEFKNEHYRRINYANHFFGRSTPKPGWMTDQGRIYIILGEPNDIQRFEGKTQTYPTVVWFYQGKTDLGLPPGFNLVFFQEGGTGEFKLYSPLKDGPQALLTSYYGDPMDYVAAFKYLREFEPDLAEVSLTLIPGESMAGMGRPTMSSDILIQRVETTPARYVRERYAQKFLDYKDIVEVEYSTNYIGSNSLVKVLRDPSGIYFVHYDVEPERLSVGMLQEKYYTTLQLNGTVADLQGKTIYQFEKKISLEFDQEQMKELSRRPLSIRDIFPLIPGKFKLSVLVKNEISKEFTSLEKELFIPKDNKNLQMTSLILGYMMKENIPTKNRLRPFQTGRYQIYLQADRTFLRSDNLVTAFQIYGLDQPLKEKGEIRYTFFKNGEEFFTQTKSINEYLDIPNFVDQFSLKEWLPAHYRIQISLWIEGREILFESEEFDVTHAETIPRPWIYSKLLPGTDDPVYFQITGMQLFNSGRMKEARAWLEKSYQAKPDSVDFALNLARLYMDLNEKERIEPVLLPFTSDPQSSKYEVYFLLGKSYQSLGKWEKAIKVFDQAVSSFGLNTVLLNSLGECYFLAGDSGEALAAWEKSLEINPDQPEIKKRIETIKKKS